MKTLKLIAIAIVLLFASNSIQAQVAINVNLGMQPSWGPVGYTSVNYYYLPDVQAYYDVRATQFIFLSGGNWIRSSHLPRQYRYYDLNRGYKVVLNDYHGSRPYTQYKYHKQKYYKGYSRPQKSIGHRAGQKENKGNYNQHESNNNKGPKQNGENKTQANKGNGHKKK